MKIGVWLKSDYSPEVGGGYSYYSRLINGIDNYSFSKEIEICYIIEGENSPQLNRPIIHLIFKTKPLTLIEKIKCRTPLLRRRTKQMIAQRTERARINEYTSKLESSDIKLIYYPIPYQCSLPDYPFITTHWDIGHRSSYAFPEVIGKMNFPEREYFYNLILPKSLFIFCESNAGKEELVRFTHLNPKRIKTVPIFAGGSVNQSVDQNKQEEILNNLSLSSNKYFYYPAQFWAHKNHTTLLKAFSVFSKSHPEYKLVFTGSDKGNLKYIKFVSHNLNLIDSVIFAGFVSQNTVHTLYINATALIMPTLMGPTNMPLLEAMECGCPVICSDFPGHREELGKAAIYINPLSEEELSMAMSTMVEKRNEYQKYVIEQSTITTFTLSHALHYINEYLIEAIDIRACWK